MLRARLIARRAALLTACFLLALLGLGVSTWRDARAQAVSLRQLAEARGFYIGTAVADEPLAREPAYRRVLRREFNMVVPEYVMKMEVVQPQRGVYDFTAMDELVAFAEEYRMAVRGHTLLWHVSLPGWLVNRRDWTREELLDVLRDHIFTVMQRYKGRIRYWDVVNEAVDDNGVSLRNTIWHQVIGPDYLAYAFRFAREADPDAVLYYNDYGGEGLGAKSNRIYELVRDLRAQGVPVDGVGLQMHVTIEEYPPYAELNTNIQRLSELGLEVQITEMDVRLLTAEPTPDHLRQQANIYNLVLNTCLSSPACTGFVTWGFTDRHSWIPRFYGTQDKPLLFDAAYQPKPAYYALRGALAQTDNWATPVPIPPTPTSTPVPANTAIRIDTGAEADYTDAAGHVWLADTGFIGGRPLERLLAIANTDRVRLYQTERYGMTGYAINIANGRYTVVLHFAETYEGITGPGQRVFSIDVEGARLNDLDVFAETGGRNIALTKTFAGVDVRDGQLTIRFIANIQNTLINAIEIIPE